MQNAAEASATVKAADDKNTGGVSSTKAAPVTPPGATNGQAAYRISHTVSITA
jgi:hypothetical protein